MKKVFASVLVLALVLLCLPAMAAQEEVNVYNWEDYISEEAIEMFERETGIKVNYMRFDLCETMYVQVRADPSSFDVIFPSDYMLERLINEDLLEEIDFANVPNAQYTLDWLKSPDYDPEMKYSVPYMWGTVGILYNTTMVSTEIDSWTDLWDPIYTDNVFMLDSVRDSIGVTLKMLGYSMNTGDADALAEAKQALIDQKLSGIVKAYQVDETKDKMAAGEGALGVVWSGDALYAMELNDKLAYAVPQEGSNVWIDPAVIPASAKNKENAEKLINFLCRPDIAQMNCEYIWYSSPNAGAIELMGEDYTENLTINPTQEIIDRCEFFHDIPENFLTVYNALWSQVKNAK